MTAKGFSTILSFLLKESFNKHTGLEQNISLLDYLLIKGLVSATPSKRHCQTQPVVEPSIFIMPSTALSVSLPAQKKVVPILDFDLLHRASQPFIFINILLVSSSFLCKTIPLAFACHIVVLGSMLSILYHALALPALLRLFDLVHVPH